MGKSSRPKRVITGAPTTRPQSATTSRPLSQAAKLTTANTRIPSQPVNGVAKPVTRPIGAAKPTTRPVSGVANDEKSTTRPNSTVAVNSTKTTTRPNSVAARDALTTTRAASSGIGAERRRKRIQQQQRQRWMPIAFTLGGIVLAIGVFFLISKLTDGTPQGTGQPVPATVMSSLTGVNASNINKIGTGGQTNPLQATPPNTPIIKNSAGLPVFFYAGGEFCPYCAAERWSMINALSRFGTFKNLHLMTSTDQDVYPNTSTFTFVGSSYTSKYLDYQPVETSDRNQQALQSLNSTQQQWFDTYDAPPYVTAQGKGGIPFISIGNQYIQISAGYNPQVLSGLSWQQIASDLSNPASPVTQGIVGNANYLTSAICKLTNNQPGNVCQSSAIQSIQKQLPKGA
jgi:hypothetical protein